MNVGVLLLICIFVRRPLECAWLLLRCQISPLTRVGSIETSKIWVLISTHFPLPSTHLLTDYRLWDGCYQAHLVLIVTLSSLLDLFSQKFSTRVGSFIISGFGARWIPSQWRSLWFISRACRLVVKISIKISRLVLTLGNNPRNDNCNHHSYSFKFTTISGIFRSPGKGKWE